jgi:hypothetical protein
MVERAEILALLEQVKAKRLKDGTDDAVPNIPGNFSVYFRAGDCCTSSSNT